MSEAWISEEQKRVEEAAEKSRKEKGLLPYLKLEKGVNEILFTDLSARPELKESKYGKQYEFKVKNKDGVEHLYGLKPEHILYKLLLKEWAKGHNAFRIMKSGKDLDTRYEILEAKKV